MMHIREKRSLDTFPATRPGVAKGKSPIYDPAHASYRSDATAAALAYVQRRGPYDGTPLEVTISIPLHLGEPLVHTAKVVIDAMKDAGVMPDDKCDVVQSLTLQRHSPSANPQTYVWINDLDSPSFSFFGVPAYSNYMPVNDDPKFRNQPPDRPSAYRNQLLREPWESLEVDPTNRPEGNCLYVGINPIEPVDLDNVCLRILDYLEVKQANKGPHRADELLSLVQARVGGTTLLRGNVEYLCTLAGT